MYTEYDITGYLYKVQIFTNGPVSHENLYRTVSKVQLWVLVGVWNACNVEQ